MKTVRTVFLKEMIDNFRDRRTLISALVMGPLFGPILFAFVINLSVKQTLDRVDETLEVPVIGAEHAPNLMSFLASRNIEPREGPASRQAAIDAVSTGEEDVVLIIPENFGADLANMVPATIEVITDQANTQADRNARRATRALQAYGQEIAAMRLTVRGVNPLVMRPLNIDEVDVSTPSGRSAILLGMLSYFFIFALLTGGAGDALLDDAVEC